MARRLKTMPLGELTELPCLVALNHSNIFATLLPPAEPDQPELPL
jgi:hypothetical protein